MKSTPAVPGFGDVFLAHSERKHRDIDNSRREARKILSQYMPNVSHWHEEAALLLAQSVRSLGPAEREEVARRAEAIARNIERTRVGPIEDFAEKPPRIAGNSQVTDAERALDSLETKVQSLRAAITPSVSP